MRRLRSLDPVELAVLAVLFVFAWVPILLALWHLRGRSGALTGADGLFPGDQLQYMSWIRESADHLLIGNQFDPVGRDRVFVHPMSLVSGLGVRLGLDVGVAYLLWKPVAVLALFGGFAAYVHRFLDGRWPRVAAMVLALFAFSPLVLLESAGDAHAVSGEFMSGALLWGYLPSVLSVALMPLFLLGLERIAAEDRVRPALTAAVAACGLLVTWLHPWQGEVLLVIVIGVVAWARLDRALVRRLVIPAAATALPLAYYFVLGERNAAWELARQVSTDAPTRALWGYAAAVLPLALVALLGLRGPARDVGERALRLWPVAVLVVWIVTPSFPDHAIAGLSLPLAILAVRGVAAVLPAQRPAGALAVTAVVLLGLVGTIEIGDALNDRVRAPAQPAWTTDDERAALDWLADQPGDGGVLPTPYLGPAVPALTARWVWIGHPSWTFDFHRRVAAARELFGGRMAPVAARDLVARSGTTWVVADCRTRVDLRRTLGDAVTGMRRFGCAAVYRVRT